MRSITAIATIAALFLFSAPLKAADVLFSISGDYTAQFRVNRSPTPDFVLEGVVFSIAGVPGFADSSNGLGDLTFFNEDFGGGLLVNDNADPFTFLFDASDGNQYYSGPESTPQFLTGTYTLSGLGTPGNFALAIAAVPEPQSWMLMIGGLGLVGGAMRVRRGRARLA